MNTFKVGDWVERTEDGSDSNYVTKGKVYKVLEVGIGLTRDTIWVIDDRGFRDYFEASFFKFSKNQIVQDIIKDL